MPDLGIVSLTEYLRESKSSCHPIERIGKTSGKVFLSVESNMDNRFADGKMIGISDAVQIISDALRGRLTFVNTDVSVIICAGVCGGGEVMLFDFCSDLCVHLYTSLLVLANVHSLFMG